MSHYQPAAFMLQKKAGNVWKGSFYFENACSRTGSIAFVSSMIGFLNANGVASFSEADVSYVCQKCFE